MHISSEMEAARAELRARRKHFYQAYATLQALTRSKSESDTGAGFKPDVETQRAIDEHRILTTEWIEHAANVVERFNAKPGTEIFRYLIERDPILESALGASPIQLAIKSGTLRRPVMVTTDDGRELEWVGLFLASGQYVGLENHDAPELRSPRERELEEQGYLIIGDCEVRLIKDGELIDGTQTRDGLFFPIDGPLAFLNRYRPTGE
ncbi:MAG: hypothetical protein VB138_11560 [Burkholderia sp.]